MLHQRRRWLYGALTTCGLLLGAPMLLAQDQNAPGAEVPGVGDDADNAGHVARRAGRPGVPAGGAPGLVVHSELSALHDQRNAISVPSLSLPL